MALDGSYEEAVFYFFFCACSPSHPPFFWAQSVILMGGDSSPLPSVPTVLGALDPPLPPRDPTTTTPKSRKATKVIPYVSLRLLLNLLFSSDIYIFCQVCRVKGKGENCCHFYEFCLICLYVRLIEAWSEDGHHRSPLIASCYNFNTLWTMDTHTTPLSYMLLRQCS